MLRILAKSTVLVATLLAMVAVQESARACEPYSYSYWSSSRTGVYGRAVRTYSHRAVYPAAPRLVCPAYAQRQARVTVVTDVPRTTQVDSGCIAARRVDVTGDAVIVDLPRLQLFLQR